MSKMNKKHRKGKKTKSVQQVLPGQRERLIRIRQPMQIWQQVNIVKTLTMLKKISNGCFKKLA